MRRSDLYKLILSILFFTGVAGATAQPDFPFTQRATWDGPFDIKMVSAPNLQPVYLDPVEAEAGGTSSGRLLADSLITSNTIRRTGDLFEINNRYKDGSSNSIFEQYDIPLPAVLCEGDPDVGGCIAGLDTRDNNSSCPAPQIRYDNPLERENVYVSMTYADYDNDLSTYSSSMAELDISQCSEIEAAYLYWSGNFQTDNPPITLVPGPLNSYSGSGDVFDISETPGTYDQVKFRVPGGAYQDVTADTRYASDRSYVCVADVTDYVAGLTGGGEFWTANLKSYPIEGNGGSTSGWTLVVVFRNPLSPPRLISLWDGFRNIGSGDAETFTLTGLQAPATNNFRSFVGFAALDGENLATQLDSDDDPEGLGFETNNGGTPVSINPFATDQPPYKLYTEDGLPATCGGGDNIGDDCDEPLYNADWCSVYDGISSSHITSYTEETGLNGNEINRLPSNVNTLGYDAHHMILPTGAVAPGATEATLTVEAGPQGSTLPFLSYLAIERLQPKLTLSKSADKNSTGLSTEIIYTLTVKNEGNAPSLGGDIIYDTLDAATNFRAGSLSEERGNTSLLSDLNDELAFEIPTAIAAGDSVVFTFIVDVIPFSENPSLFDPPTCKRTIENTAYIQYNTLSSGLLQTKSNSNDCGIGSETRVILVDEQLTNSTTNAIGPIDACGLEEDVILDRIRQELSDAGVPDAEIANFDIRDSDFERIQPEDTFGNISGSEIYLAIQDINSGTGCQEIFEFDFTCIDCTLEITSDTADTLCSATPLNYTISANEPAASFRWSREAVAGISNSAASNRTTNPINEVLTNTTSNPITVNYQIIAEIPDCDPDTINLAVNVQPLPAGIISLDEPVICPGESTTLTVNVGASSGLRTLNLLQSNQVLGTSVEIPGSQTTYQYTISDTGSYQVSVEQSSFGCTSLSNARVLNHYDTLKAEMSGDAFLCANGDSTSEIAIIITGNTGSGPYTYTYQRNGNAPVTGNIFSGNETVLESSPINAGVSTPDEYSLISLTDANGCAALPENLTGRADIQPVPEPVAEIAEQTGALIQTPDNDFDLTDNNTLSSLHTRNWIIDPQGSAATLSDNSSPQTTINDVPESTPAIVTLEISDGQGACPTDRDSVSIIQRNITVAALQNDTICLGGGALTHTISPESLPDEAIGETAYWSAIGLPAGNATISTNPASYELSVDVTEGGEYVFEYTIENPSVTQADGSPISSSALMTLVVDETVSIANAGEDDTVCSPSYTLNAEVPVSGTGFWEEETIISDTLDAQASFSIPSAQTITLHWKIVSEYSKCASSADEVSITRVNDVSQPTVNDDMIICETEVPIELQGTPPVNLEEGNWTGPGTLADAGSPTTNVNDLGPGNYMFTYTLSNGFCPAQSSAFEVTVEAQPSAADAGADVSFCGSSFQLQATPATSGTGTWQVISGSASVSDENNPNAQLGGIDGSVDLRWSISTGSACPNSEDVVTVEAVDVVTPLVTLSAEDADNTICVGQTVQLTTTLANGGANPDYSWEINGISRPETDDAITITPAMEATYVVNVTMESSESCATPSVASDQIILNATMLAPPVILNNNDTLCENELPYELVASTNGESGFWYRDGVAVKPLVKGETTDTILIQSASEDGYYEVRESDNICPEVNSDSTYIQVDLIPEISAESGFDVLQNNTVQLSGITNAPQWLWKPSSQMDDATSLNPVYQPEETGTQEIWFIAINGHCTDSVALTGIVRSPVFVPNAFTPNGDGENEFWDIKGLDTYPSMELTVFNRYGNAIYANKGSYSPWDGLRNGQKMPVGTYYYVIKLNTGLEKEEPLTGSVTIVR